MGNDDLDRLHAAPLDQFTSTRNSIAAELKKRGDDERAAQIKALKKPSVVTWAVNALARARRAEIERLLDVGDRLRKAHRKALSRAGTADLREVAQQERDALRALIAHAERIMKDAGISATRAQLAAVEETLAAAAVDDEARDLLAAGHLTRAMQRVGFGDVSGFTVIRGGRAADGAAERPDAEEMERIRELEREARSAERNAERLERIADTAAEKLRLLRSRIDDAELEARRTQRAAAEAREEAARARTRAERESR